MDFAHSQFLFFKLWSFEVFLAPLPSINQNLELKPFLWFQKQNYTSNINNNKSHDSHSLYCTTYFTENLEKWKKLLEHSKHLKTEKALQSPWLLRQVAQLAYLSTPLCSLSRKENNQIIYIFWCKAIQLSLALNPDI